MVERLLSLGEVCGILQISKRTAYNWRYLGLGPRAIKVGGVVRYRSADVEDWLEKNADPEPAV